MEMITIIKKRFSKNIKITFDFYGDRIEDICFNDQSFDKWYSDVPLHKYLYNFSADIIALDKVKCDNSVVGRLTGYYFDVSDFSNLRDGTFFGVCDIEDIDLSLMSETITDSDGNILPSFSKQYNSFIYLKELYIDSQYRNHGLGSYILDNLHKMLKYNFHVEIQACILIPSPPEETKGNKNVKLNSENYSQVKDQLINFYKNHGFDFLLDSEHMIKNYV